jgi:hypothetical protein
VSPRWRKAALTSHVVSSVGWLGAVAAFLALAVAAVTTPDVGSSRSLYVAMDVLGLWLLVPLSLWSFASGLVQGWVTSWGLLRHWWVVFKLSISVVATGILLLYTRTLEQLGDAAQGGDPHGLLPSSSPVVHATGAVVLLLVAAALSVFKPKGLTRYGWRKQQAAR